MAAVEWVMRNGGTVKWKNHQRWLTDYNEIGYGTGTGNHVEAIDATESSITEEGFEYLSKW